MKYFLIFALIGLTAYVGPDVLADQRDPVLESSILWEVGTIQWLEDVYSPSGTAVVRVIDHNMNRVHGEIDNFDVDVWSDTDLAGIDLTVTETEISSGVFEGTVFFSTADDSSGHRLRISHGDTIYSKYADITIPKSDYDDLFILIDTAVINGENPAQKIDDRVALDKESYEWGDDVTITITAPELNTDHISIEEISNDEKSPVEITTRHFKIKEFSLVETDIDTGIFSGTITLNADDLPSADRVDYGNDGITVNFEYQEDTVAIGSSPISNTEHEGFTGKQLELLVSPIIPKLIPSDEPVDSLIIRDIKNSPVWGAAQFPIVGLDFVEGNTYHIIAKKSEDFNPLGNNKYELIEIKHIFKPHEPYSWKSLCAPGYFIDPLGNDCVFAFRCSEDAYPGKPCTVNWTEQNYLRPLQQQKVGILTEDTICLENLQLIIGNDNTPACVKQSSVEKLLERGFVLGKNNNDSPYE